MGYYNERPTAALETARRKAMFEFRSRWDLNTTLEPAEPLQWATAVGLVDGAREKNKARAVVGIYLNRGRYPLGGWRERENKARAVIEIYLNRGRYPLGLYPFDTTHASFERSTFR